LSLAAEHKHHMHTNSLQYNKSARNIQHLKNHSGLLVQIELSFLLQSKEVKIALKTIFTEKNLSNSIIARTAPGKFILLSLLVHVLVISFQAIHTPKKDVEIKPKPIHIKYIPNKEIKAEESPGEVVNIPEPKKSEKPEETNLLSNVDSRAHSDQNQSEINKYSRKKRIAPKKSSTAIEKQEQTKPIPKVEEKKQELDPELNGSELLSSEEIPPAEEIPESTTSKGLTALLDGIDPEKYASSDTLDPLAQDADDGESISLNTKEVKYASYFARVKHQIERVWNYPLEAAKKGIQGNVDLRFIISKDGSLKGVWVKDSSREEILDVAAIKAVQDAAPFYPFPLSIQRDKLSIIATFVYSPRFRHARSND